MSEPYYVGAVGAFRKSDDGPGHIAIAPVVVHPDAGSDPEQLALDTARREVFPETDGWYDHHAVVTELNVSLVAIIEAEKTAVPNELRIVRIPLEVAP